MKEVLQGEEWPEQRRGVRKVQGLLGTCDSPFQECRLPGRVMGVEVSRCGWPKEFGCDSRIAEGF